MAVRRLIDWFIPNENNKALFHLLSDLKACGGSMKMTTTSVCVGLKLLVACTSGMSQRKQDIIRFKNDSGAEQ